MLDPPVVVAHHVPISIFFQLSPAPTPKPRKSARTSKPPVWLSNYVMPYKSTVCAYPLNGCH